MARVQLLHNRIVGDSGEDLNPRAVTASMFCVALHMPLKATAFPAMDVRLSQYGSVRFKIYRDPVMT